MPASEFFQTYQFTCCYRAKKSGSSTSTPKYIEKQLPVEWKTHWEGKYLIAENVFPETKIIGKNSKDAPIEIYVDNQNRIKILSNTKNGTFIFSVRRKL